MLILQSMIIFEKTTHLSSIIEKSEENPVVIFKYSSKCYTSEELKQKLEQAKVSGAIQYLIFLVVVQDSPILSKKIEAIFKIKHESPQIIVLYKNQVTYFESHDKIVIENLQNVSIQ